MQGYFPRRFFWPAFIFMALSIGVRGLAKTGAAAHTTAQPEHKIGRRLALAKDAKARELVLKESLKASPESSILHFYWGSLSLERGSIDAWRLAFSHVQSSPLAKNIRLMKTLLEKAPIDERPFLANALIENGIISQAWKSSCPFFELERRKERGEFLYHLIEALGQDKKQLAKLWHELFITFPEVIDVALLRRHENFALWQRSLSIADMLERINNLMLFGKNKEAKESFDGVIASHPELSLHERCALDYEGAKLQRKLRHYKEAKRRFADLALRCSALEQKKARYMELQLIAMASDKSELAKFDTFVSDYPKDSFSDDVLFWKATIFLDNNEKAQALATLEQLLKLFPHGDMNEQALFQKAFTQAALGESKKAIVTLSELKEKASPHSLAYAQARYWLARLAIYTDLKTRIVNNAPKKALLELGLLAKDPNPTLYSWLAFRLLEDLKVPALTAEVARPALKKKPSMPSSSLQFIEDLVTTGFNSEALALLNEEPLEGADAAHVAALAHLYLELGQPEAGHQKLIRCDEKLAASLKQASAFAFEQISWPKPFEVSVLEVSNRLQISPQVITSIMRQESGFLKEALSWADARGAMQLMIITANEEARRLGLEKIRPHDLFDPKLNILLGTSALKNYWLRFGTLPLALSAYNAGPAAAKKWQMAYKDMPMDVLVESIPYKETRQYVFAVLGNLINYTIRDKAKLPAFELPQRKSL